MPTAVKPGFLPSLSHPQSGRVSKLETWVVYLMNGKKTIGMKAVCEQSEWNAMELAHPGILHLVRDGIATESEAELLARGDSGAGKPRGWKTRQ